MLQPGMCSASLSDSRTWVGPPGALATHSASRPSPSGGMLGPPMPTCGLLMKEIGQVRKPVGVGAGVRVDVGDDLAGGRLESGVAGVCEAAVLGVDQPEAVVVDAISALLSVEPSLTTITS